MEIGYLFSVMKADLYSFYCWVKNNRGYAFMMLLWPYLMAFFLLGLGSILGSLEEYSRRMDLVNPVFYIVASSSIMVSSISIVDNVAMMLLRHRWIGTLPYIVSSPPGLIIYAIAAPIPSTMITSFVSLTSILPVIAFIEGLAGVYKLFIILLFIYMAMLPLIGISVVIGGLSLLAREETNIASFLTPFILLVSGVFYPQTILPWILQVIGKALPLVYVVEATKIMAIYHLPPFNKLYPLIGFLVGLAIIYNTVAAPGVKFIEKKIVESGVYEE